MGKKIGIDLGTTYSCVAYLNENEALEVLKNSEGSNVTPSLVFFASESNVVVGETARAESMYAPENLVERIKSYMGDPDYTINKFGEDFSPTAVSSLILRKLKKDAEEALGDTIDGVVITCPAYFGTSARAATQKAGEDAGLNVIQVINEPTAAAFAYAYVKNEDVDKTVLIYDLGGGTFDVTMLKMNFQGNTKDLKVLASNGDHTLGGKDWDGALTDFVIEKFCEATGCDGDEMREDAEIMGWLSENIEKTKKKLSSLETVKLGVNWNGNKQMLEISREDFEGVTENLLNKTIDLVNAMLNEKGMTMDQVDEIILVGGSTRMTQVTKRLESEYGKPLISFEPDEAVAKGAALMAALAYNYSEGEGDSTGTAAPDIFADPNATPAPDAGGCFTMKTGETIKITDIVNKSYGVKVYDADEQKYYSVNLVKKGTEKPCEGDSSTIMPITLGGASSITVCESDYEEDVVEAETTTEVFTGSISVFSGLPSDTAVVVKFNLNESSILRIFVEAAGQTVELEFDSSKGGASTAGCEAAKRFSLS